MPDRPVPRYLGEGLGLLPGPLQPAAALGTAGLEHQLATGSQAASYSGEGARPVLLLDDRLRDIAGHHREVDPAREIVRHRGGIPVHPPHRLSSRLASGDVQRRARRVHPHDLEAPLGDHQRERAGAAAHVQHAPRLQLGDDRGVRVQVAAVRVQRVVDSGEARMLEEVVGHPVTLGGSGHLRIRVRGRIPVADPRLTRSTPGSA